MTERNVVLPGDFLADEKGRAGPGTYVQDDKVYSSTYGLLDEKEDRVRVIPLAGKYVPEEGDMVVGMIIDITPFNWIVDINAPGDALLHVSGYPEHVEYNQLAKHMRIGEMIKTRIVEVSPSMKIELTLDDRGLHVIRSGQVIEISPAKVPRVIGRGGSMIGMIKDLLNVKIFVGQNGCIWIDGRERDVEIAIEVIEKIDREAHTSGLTDRVKEYIKERKGEK